MNGAQPLPYRPCRSHRDLDIIDSYILVRRHTVLLRRARSRQRDVARLWVRLFRGTRRVRAPSAADDSLAFSLAAQQYR
jgi:hypothetical protein